MSDSVRPHRWQPTRLPRPWDSPGKNTGVGCHFLLQCMKVKSESGVAQLCPTLSDPMDCTLPGSSVDGIFQARVLEWGAIAFSGVLCRWRRKEPVMQRRWEFVWCRRKSEGSLSPYGSPSVHRSDPLGVEERTFASQYEDPEHGLLNFSLWDTCSDVPRQDLL